MIDILSIDEEITHAREVAEIQRKDNDNCKYKSQYGCKDCADYYSKSCIECAEEHEQLADLLELLKWYQQGMEDIPSEIGVLPKDVYLAGYNKALEDYHRLIADEIKNDPVNPYLLHLYNFNNHIKKCLTKR